MTLVPHEDPYGHVKSENEVHVLQAAVKVLNGSETWGLIEENANHHSAAEARAEFAEMLHVADVSEWTPDKHDPESEEGVCSVCHSHVRRQITAEERPDQGAT